MKQAFKDILNRLKTIPEFRYVGEDWGQLNFEQPPVEFPCALIDLGDADFASAGARTQQVTAIVNITIADIRYNGVTTEEQVNKSFEIFDLIDKANQLLHGTGGENYSRLCRIRLKKTLREDAVREFVLTYKFACIDNSAMPVYQKNQPNPEFGIK